MSVSDQQFQNIRKSLEEMTRDRDAFRKAKSENDERYMLERDEARRERDDAREELSILKADVEACYVFAVENSAPEAATLIRGTPLSTLVRNTLMKIHEVEEDYKVLQTELALALMPDEGKVD